MIIRYGSGASRIWLAVAEGLERLRSVVDDAAQQSDSLKEQPGHHPLVHPIARRSSILLQQE
ncbi:hypothetical protein RvY_06322 [Ramazzottius varieornatus]|uniref:Uncharacterized protein n=1 Tax=Ramazzottius varieornatus TaxID=947166 RepID=A0A1D1UY68_RAMVA|nr:hypothetical protein RvY_06322 [Ramazzottius varieornatus]